MKSKIIFLDIDGVLNTDQDFEFYYVNPKNLEVLVQIVKETSAEIVLISTWKFIPEAMVHLTSTFDKAGLSIVDVTFDRYDDRAEGIKKWLSERKDIENYVILDDELFDYEETGISSKLVHIDSNLGLTLGRFSEILSILNNEKFVN